MAKIDMRKKQAAVEIVVDNTYGQINGLSTASVISALDFALSFAVPGAKFTKAYRDGWWDPKQKKYIKWDGRTRLLKKGRFLSGMLNTVVRALKNNGVQYTIIDNRVKPKSGKPISIKKSVESREYQNRVMEAIKKKTQGQVQVATGGGKSLLIAQTAANLNVRTVIYVPGVDLLYQTRDAIESFLCRTKVGIIGDGIVDVKKITVCTIWSAVSALGAKLEKMGDEDTNAKESSDIPDKLAARKAIEAAELFIVDECQFLATKTLQCINESSSNAFYKFGFSATPYREDGGTMLLEAVCGQVIVNVMSSELIKKGFLVQPQINFIDIPPYIGTSTKYQSIYKEYITENHDRNGKIVAAALKLHAAGRKTLILIKNIGHGETLLEMFPENLEVCFLRGNIDSGERNRVRDEFTAGRVDIIIASVIYDQGINLPICDGLILGGGGKSKGRALQRIGRVIRTHPGKKDAIVVDFIDNAKYLVEHSKVRIETYRAESEFVIKLPQGKSAGRKKKEPKAPDNSGW